MTTFNIIKTIPFNNGQSQIIITINNNNPLQLNFYNFSSPQYPSLLVILQVENSNKNSSYLWTDSSTSIQSGNINYLISSISSLTTTFYINICNENIYFVNNELITNPPFFQYKDSSILTFNTLSISSFQSSSLVSVNEDVACCCIFSNQNFNYISLSNIINENHDLLIALIVMIILVIVFFIIGFTIGFFLKKKKNKS